MLVAWMPGVRTVEEAMTVSGAKIIQNKFSIKATIGGLEN